MEEILVGLLGKYDEGDGSEIVLHTIFAGCISSDTLSTRNGCKSSRQTLLTFMGAVSKADIGDETKTSWYKKIEDGLNVVTTAEAMFS